MMIKSEVIIDYKEIEKLVKDHLEKIHGLDVSSIYDRKTQNGEFNGYKVILKNVDKPLATKIKLEIPDEEKVMI
jgi:hypothetical protein